MEQEKGHYYKTSDKVKLWFAFRKGGSSKVAVFLPGNGVNHTELEDLALCFHNDGFSILMYDPRGHGYSEKPCKKEAYSLERLAQDLEELLIHNNITHRTFNVFVGQSVGASTGVYYQATRSYPVFDMLVLLTPSWDYKETVHNWVPPWLVQKKVKNNAKSTKPPIGRTILNYMYYPIKRLLKVLGIKVCPPDFKAIVCQAKPSERDYILGSRGAHFILSTIRDLWVALNIRFGLSKEDFWALWAASTMLLTYNITSHLRKLNVPVLFIGGDMDLYIDHRKLSKLCELVTSPRSDLYIIKGATHTLSFTHPYHCWMYIKQKLDQYLTTPSPPSNKLQGGVPNVRTEAT